jgi:von Willebrand factor type A domain
MRRRRRPAIDSHDVADLRGVARRTMLVRLVLAAAAVAALVATVVSVRSFDPHRRTIVPSGSSGVIVVDVSLSIANSYGDVRRSLRNVMSGDSPIGLVVFSDVAYELLPPGTPASELEPVLRVLTPPRRGDPPTPWTTSFRGGTRISDALELGGRMLERQHVENGSVVLISDLQTAPDDVTDLARTIDGLKSRGVAVRVVPIGALSDGRLLFTRLLGRDAFSEPTRSADNEARPLRSADSAGLPIGLLTLASLFFLALAAHERYASRLALPRST